MGNHGPESGAITMWRRNDGKEIYLHFVIVLSSPVSSQSSSLRGGTPSVERIPRPRDTSSLARVLNGEVGITNALGRCHASDL